MRQPLKMKLWNDFKKLQYDENGFRSFVDYYLLLATWVRCNMKSFNASIIENSRIRFLVNIDPREYVVEDPGISLDMEPRRLFSNRPKTVNVLIMLISDTLWDLVTIRSSKACPICVYDDLRYLIAENKLSKERRLILECDSCGYVEFSDGTSWNGEIVDIFPVNKNELVEYGVKL